MWPDSCDQRCELFTGCSCQGHFWRGWNGATVAFGLVLFTDHPYNLVNRALVLNKAAHEACLSGDVQNGDLRRHLAQPLRLQGIQLIHATADSIVPMSETRGLTN